MLSRGYEDQRATVARLRLYEEVASSSGRIKAIYPWIYQDYVVAGRTLYWGARSLPLVLDAFKKFYDSLESPIAN